MNSCRGRGDAPGCRDYPGTSSERTRVGNPSESESDSNSDSNPDSPSTIKATPFSERVERRRNEMTNALDKVYSLWSLARERYEFVGTLNRPGSWWPCRSGSPRWSE